MMTTPKLKFTILMIHTTSVLNTFSSEVILINFQAYVQFHSDPSSSTRIRVIHLDRPTGLFTRMLRVFHSEYNFHSEYFHLEDNFTRMTIIPLGYLYFHSTGKFSLDRKLSLGR